MRKEYKIIISSVADFDEIWNHLPHASFYQMRILSFAGYLGIVAGFMAIYPVFAQYAPPSRCETVFDQNAGSG
jgi:OCT family organic cation transporter-like MFS transporter 4/5